MNEQLNIMSIVDIILKKWYVIFIMAIVGGLAAYIFTDFFIVPKYSAATTLYVNSSNNSAKNDEVSSSTISSSRQLVNTYAEILKARDFLSKVCKDLGNKYSTSEMKNMLTMKALNDTEVLSVSVKGANKTDVFKIAESISKYATDELKNVVGAGSVTILESPLEPTSPVSPNVRVNTLIGVFAGIALAAFSVIILSLLDTRIKGGEEFAGRYEEPLLGEIPTIDEE